MIISDTYYKLKASMGDYFEMSNDCLMLTNPSETADLVKHVHAFLVK